MTFSSVSVSPTKVGGEARRAKCASSSALVSKNPRLFPTFACSTVKFVASNSSGCGPVWHGLPLEGDTSVLLALTVLVF